jgi:hypothetical protein
MRGAQEILEILQTALPELARDFHVTRLALFGSYARGQQTEASDVDILVEVDPSIGLRFVDRPLLVVTSAGAGWRSGLSRCSAFPRTWSPAGPSPLGTGRSSKRSWSMSRRPAGLLIEELPQLAAQLSDIQTLARTDGEQEDYGRDPGQDRLA